MQKLFLIAVFGIFIISFLSLNLNLTTKAVYQEEVCNPPYMSYKGGCCLDENSNNICDEQESFQNHMTPEQDTPEETGKELIIQENKSPLNFIKKGLEKVKSLFSKEDVTNPSSIEKNMILLIPVISILILVILIFLIRRIKKRKQAKSSLPVQEQPPETTNENPQETQETSELNELSVYRKTGERIGKVIDSYTNPETSEIEGWAIELDEDVAKSMNLTERKFFVKKGEYDIR
jgi:sporulation protein YlmC with PRC-barrel domain